MADESLLKQAGLLYRKGRFSAAVELLEPQIFRYREDPLFFRIMGLSCLQNGDRSGAETYLQRFRQLAPQFDRDVLLGLMVCAAKKADYSGAVQICLQILDREPTCRQAKSALSLMRKALASDNPTEIVRSKAFEGTYPTAKAFPIGRVLLVGASVLLVLGGLWFGASFTWNYLSSLKPSVSPTLRPGPGLENEKTSPTDSSTATQQGGNWRVTLTDDQVREAYRNAQKNFQDYRDSLARKEINRILLSNASQAMKEKARSLIPFLHDPDFAQFQDNLTYQEVRDFWELYEGCSVKWKGVIANLKSGKNEISFDFLLGYQDGQVVEGVVPVKLKFAALLKNSQVIEVLGQVDSDAGKWFLRGVALRDIGYKVP